MDVSSRDGCSIVGSFKDGSLSAGEICRGFTERIQRMDRDIRAFSHFDAAAVFRQAEALDRRAAGPPGKLAGLPIGIKDIFDTSDFPTGYGSPIYAGHRPTRDCSVVARLKAQGAVLLGKTETSEFAYMKHGPTRNPHRLSCTPGSSSAGSAAGLAAGFFPVALGTQTAGSLLKPASYCGLFAYKPTCGLVSLEGVKPLSPSLDTVGWFGRSVRDLGLLAEVLLEIDCTAPSAQLFPLRLAVAKTSFWSGADGAAQEALELAVSELVGAGHRVSEPSLPCEWSRLAAAQATLNVCEGSRSLAHEIATYPTLVSKPVHELRFAAAHTGVREEIEARRFIASSAAGMDFFMENYDAILTLSVGCEAPGGLESTGPSDFIRTWNALGMPQVNVPYAHGTSGLPLGLQLVGARGQDRSLIGVASRVSHALGQCSIID